MTLDPRLRDHIDRLADHYQTGTGDLQRVLDEGRRRVRRRRLAHATEAAMAVVALAVTASIIAGVRQSPTPAAQPFAQGQADATEGGIAVQRLETGAADLSSQAVATDDGFIVLVTEQPRGLWRAIAGWFGSYADPELVAYRTADGREWTRTAIPTESFRSGDWGADDVARTSDGAITVLANGLGVDPQSIDPPSAVLYTTDDDLEGWERRLIDVTPDRPLPDGLIWEDGLASFDLIETGERPGVIARVGPAVDHRRFSSSRYDYETGWSMTDDAGTTRIPIAGVYPDDDADRADTVLVVRDDDEWVRLPLSGLPTDEVTDLTFRDGAWYAAVGEGETRTGALPLVGLYRWDAPQWRPVTTSIVGSPIGFFDDGLLIQPPGVPGSSPDVGSLLPSEILTVGYAGQVDRISLRTPESPLWQLRLLVDGTIITAADRQVAVASGPLLDLDMAAFDELPPEASESPEPTSGIDTAWYRQRLTEDGLVPMAYRNGYLLARRGFRPLEWWIFDLQR